MGARARAQRSHICLRENGSCDHRHFPALVFKPSMATEADATSKTGPELRAAARELVSTPNVNAATSDANEMRRVRFSRELDVECSYKVPRQSNEVCERRCSQTVVSPASWRDSPPPRTGWSYPSADARSCKDARRKRAMTRTREASPEGEQRKRCFASPSGGPACRHLAVKVFPTGPRDNGEMYWQCAFCGADL